MDSIKVKITSQFGNERIFPVCEKADLFASIAGTKTLTRSNIAYIKALGFDVDVVPEVASL